MNTCVPDEPIVLECEYPTRPIGFTAQRTYIAATGYPGHARVSVSADGYGHSEVSQQEADDMALERAIERSSLMLKWKVRALVRIARMFGLSFRAKNPQMIAALVNEKLIAPLYSGWRGKSPKKPSEYKVTACIPHLETPEPLEVCIRVLRAQSERPYIIVVDTGSSRETCDTLEKLRADDVEIHYIRGHGYSHASEPVTVALDVAQALCRTEFIFHTHADCFLTRLNFLETMMGACNPMNPVIGYRMSPREWVTDEWEWMVGHTATFMHMPTIHKIGATWSMQRMNIQYGYPWVIKGEGGKCGGWPDTETGFNCILRDANIRPTFIGFDENGKRQRDLNIDHVRSYAGSKIYSEKYHTQAASWMVDAMADANDLVNKK